MHRITAKDRRDPSREFLFLVPVGLPSEALTLFRAVLEARKGFVSDYESTPRPCGDLDPGTAEAQGSVSPSWFESDRYFTIDGYPLRRTMISLTCPTCGDKGHLVIAQSPRREVALDIECTACGTRQNVAPPDRT